MLKFEDQVPMGLRTGETELVAETVGELRGMLEKLPEDLPLLGLFFNGMYSVRVVTVGGDEPYLACVVEPYDDEADEDEDEFDEDFDD